MAIYDNPAKLAESAHWKDGEGNDPARYLVNPGGGFSFDNPPSPGNLRHGRPYITVGSKLFAFPVGVEAFRRSGQATLGLHRAIGDKNVIANTVHFDEARIELSGMFPGVKAQDNMTRCLDVLTTPQTNGMKLHCPGVFDSVQIVLPENWDFSHSEDDRTHSISYTISFVKISTGKTQKDPHGKPAQQGPIRRRKPKGKSHRTHTVKAGTRTLRGIAKLVYKDADKWKKLVKLNQGQLNAYVTSLRIPNHKIPTYRWPLGTKFRY